MAGENGGSKADTLVKVVLVFFISLLSFSVGTFVGKQVSDSDHRNLALEGEYGKGGRKVASVKESEDDESDGEKISEKEVDSLTEEFINKDKSREPAQAKPEESAAGAGDEDESKTEASAKEKSPVRITEPTKEIAEEPKPHKEGYKTYTRGKKEAAKEAGEESPKEAVKESTKKSVKESSGEKSERSAGKETRDPLDKVSAKVLAGEEPSDGKKEVKALAPKLPSVAASAVGKFAVQVASYADEKEAKEYVSRLKERGFTAFYLAAKVKARTWYRVQVGLFDNVKSAEEYKLQVNQELGGAMPIVQKIVQ